MRALRRAAPLAETARFIVSGMDVSLLVAELRDVPIRGVPPLLPALLRAAQELETQAPSQGAPPTTTDLILSLKEAEQFRAWLASAARRAGTHNDTLKADAFARIWASLR